MSNPIEDYINSLEGKTELDPLAIARDLRELHMQEIGTREAKIETLNTTIADKDSELAAKLAEIQAQKAKNFDLAMQIPGNTDQQVNRQDDEKPNGSTIQVSDLFNKKTRERHFKIGR